MSTEEPRVEAEAARRRMETDRWEGIAASKPKSRLLTWARGYSFRRGEVTQMDYELYFYAYNDGL
jgi:hypothetical protein